MAKIIRKQQKQFGGSASANQIAKFGSLAAAAPERYDGAADPDDIQALSQFLDGWFNSVLGSNSPAIEDRNALDYLFAYQLGYLFQQGIPEWETNTEYHIGSLAQDGAGLVYKSITNTNSGNALTDNTKWIAQGFVKPGMVLAVFSNITGAFAVPATGVVSEGYQYCDGAAIPANHALSGNVPDLTDDRFIMGATSAGTTGGTNDSSHDHSVTSNVTATHAHTHTMGTHNHKVYDDAGVGNVSSVYNSGGSLNGMNTGSKGAPAWALNAVASATPRLAEDAWTNNVDPGDTNGASTSTVSVTNNAVTSGGASATDNRPQYVEAQYLMFVG